VAYLSIVIKLRMMKARYVRVSTGDQKMARQEVKKQDDEILYCDTVSGAMAFSERENGKRLHRDVLDGKIKYISVSSIDRLGRNLIDILQTLEFFKQFGVTVKVDNLGLVSLIDGKENSAFNLIISVMGNVASMERQATLERIREGIAIRKAQNLYKGREKGTVESDEKFLSKYKEVWKNLKKGHSLRDTAKLCSVSLGTVQKVKKKLQF